MLSLNSELLLDCFQKFVYNVRKYIIFERHHWFLLFSISTDRLDVDSRSFDADRYCIW
jgi:hypothetical protein